MARDYWKIRLRPFDAELCRMVESLTERPCNPKNGGDHYYIMVDYTLHNKPEYIMAIMDAIEGRVGERLITIKDYPESAHFAAYIKFSNEDLPGLIRCENETKGEPEAGELFCRHLEEKRAVKVSRNNAEALFKFVGNGEMEISDEGPANFHFLNVCGSVYTHAREGQYIVYTGPECFKVVDAETFEREYEPK